MKRNNNSLAADSAYLIGPGKIKIHNGRLAYTTGTGSPTRLDPESLKSVVCYGNVGVTDEALRVLFYHKVNVSWLSSRGNRFRGRLAGVVDGTSALRRLQCAAMADAGRKLQLARDVVCGKVRSQIQAARHFQRHGSLEAKHLIHDLSAQLTAAERTDSIDVLRGIEGTTTKNWFSVWASRLKHGWKFPGRVRRPPTDPVNALLSLSSTFLLNKAIARIQAAGLDESLGALHEFRHGRPSLACDLIEPLRAPTVERWVLKVCNRRVVKPADFESDPAKGVRLTREAFPNVLTHWEEDWLETRAQRLLEREVNEYVATLRAKAQ
jgi:CRISPR-associated protein Cas1